LAEIVAVWHCRIIDRKDHARMKTMRLVHFYLGVFFAPLILFFAFSGVLQVFKLHEAYREIPGSQGDWIAWFGQFHKEQAWIAPRVAPVSRPKAAPEARGPRPMKWLVALMGASLMATTLLGLWIAFNYPRRKGGFFAAFGAGIVIPLALMASSANAQEYPTRPIKIVVPQATGSGADVVARMLAEKMTLELGQAVVVDNRPGANGIVASSLVAREPPDGYTLLQTSVSLVSFNPFIYKNMGFDPIKDFTFIAPIADASFVVVASIKSGIRSWTEFLARAKANPDGLTYGSAGAGNSTHLYAEMVARRAGVKLRHIPYKGSGPALLAIVAGEIDVMVVPTVVAAGQLTGDKLVPLAQSGDVRSPQLPNVPLLKELAPDVPPLPGWYALVGPAKMDAKVVQKLAAAVNHFLADPAVKAKLQGQFLEPIPGTPDSIQKRGESEAALWGGLIRQLGIQGD